MGSRKAGRICWVERHSVWTPTTHPYDTKSFGEAGSYNYGAAYRYLDQFYTMSRLLESDPIDDTTLAACDVLIIKLPNVRYSTAEVDAIVRFIRGGGGLLLIGDHTNLDRSSAYMNDITRNFGFTFRNDLQFGTESSPYEERHPPPGCAHPAAQHVPWFDFAVSCSIDPGWSLGRAAVVESGLWSMPSEYHMENYHPYPQHCPEMHTAASFKPGRRRRRGGPRNRVRRFDHLLEFLPLSARQGRSASEHAGVAQPPQRLARPVAGTGGLGFGAYRLPACGWPAVKVRFGSSSLPPRSAAGRAGAGRLQPGTSGHPHAAGAPPTDARGDRSRRVAEFRWPAAHTTKANTAMACWNNGFLHWAATRSAPPERPIFPAMPWW